MEGPSGDKRLCLPGSHSHQPKGPAKLSTCGLASQADPEPWTLIQTFVCTVWPLEGRLLPGGKDQAGGLNPTEDILFR